MLARVCAAKPDARDVAFTVEPMVPARGGVELIVGAYEDAQFGPVIVFGHGGTAVEVRGDTVLGLPPLNLALAHAMIARTRVLQVARGLSGLASARSCRDRIDAAARFAADDRSAGSRRTRHQSAVRRCTNGAIALDVRIRVAAASAPGTRGSRSRPYPSELEETIALADGQTLLLRPIRPEDEPALHAAFAKLTAEEIRMRFFVAMQSTAASAGGALHADRLRPRDGAGTDDARPNGRHLGRGAHSRRPRPRRAPSLRFWCVRNSRTAVSARC